MKLPYADTQESGGIVWQNSFGGLDMRLSASDGEVVYMQNMTGEYFPVLSPRERRWKRQTLTTPGALGGGDALFWADGTDFYYSGVRKGSVSSGQKSFCCLGPWVTIWPDKKYYNTKTDEFGSLEASLTVSNAVLRSSASPGGISDEANCLQLPDTTPGNSFAANEAVTISGCSRSSNNKTLIIREISGNCLYFYDNSFSLDSTAVCEIKALMAVGTYYFADVADGTYYNFTTDTVLHPGYKLMLDRENGNMDLYTLGGSLVDSYSLGMGASGTELTVSEECLPETENAVTITRAVPALDYVCQCDNRLWGTEGNSIRCCYLGNPKIWNNFDTTATSCWTSEVGSPGVFTGAFAYGGYPLLFKENHIYRVYGTKSADFQILDTETLGSENGSGKSFAVVGQTLYYKSCAGFVAYSGGVPRLIDAALGAIRWQNAVAGTDGKNYYVSCYDGSAWSLLVYNSENKLWYREDTVQALDFARSGGELHMLNAAGEVWMLGQVRSGVGTREAEISSVCEFADMPGASGEQNAVQRLHFKLRSEGDLTVEVQYDSNGHWEKLTDIRSTGRCIKTVELLPRRADHFRLRICGCGDWKLWAIGREYAPGSRKGG